MFYAYREDGTKVKFTHPVDYREGLRRGLLQNPPGSPKPLKKAPKPEGEKVSGIEPIAAPDPEVYETVDEKPVELEIAKKKEKVNRIHRK
jgi:hypothetical protein